MRSQGNSCARCWLLRAVTLSCWLLVAATGAVHAQNEAQAFEEAHQRISRITDAFGYSQQWLRDLESKESESGMRTLSWRVHMLPRLGFPDLYEKFHLDEPWDSPHNKQMIDQMPDVFRFGNDQQRSRIRFIRRSASAYPDTVTVGQFPDGDDQTIQLFLGGPQDAVIWTKPEPLLGDAVALTTREATDPTIVVTASGTVYSCPNGLHPAKLEALVSSNQFEHVSPKSWLSAERAVMAPPDGYRGSPEPDSWPRDGELKQRVTERLKKIGPALTKLSIPSNTQLSWRVHLLPALGHEELYQRFHLNEPWDSRHNYQLINEMPAEYRVVPVAGRTPLTAVDRMIKTYTNGSPWQRNSDGKLAVFCLGTDHLEIWTKPSAAPWLSVTQEVLPSAIDGVTCDGRLVTIPADTAASKRIALVDPANSAKLDIDRWFGSYSELDVQKQRAASTVRGGISLPKVRPPVPIPGPKADCYYSLMNSTNNPFAVTYNGLLKYKNTHQRFPDTRTASRESEIKLSWRVKILPMIGQQELYDQFDHDAPWDSPQNRKLLSKMPNLFRMKGDPPRSTKTRMCLYLAAEAVFDGSSTPIQMDYNRIRDSNRGIVIGGTVGKDKAVPWTKPQDIEVDIDNFVASLGNIGDSVTLFTLHSNTVRLPTNLPNSVFRAMLTRAGGEMVDMDRVERWAAQYYRMPYVNQAIGVTNDATYLDRMHHVVRPYWARRETVPPLDYDKKTRKRFMSKNLSWRVHLLRNLDYGDLHKQFRFDEPWDSPHNSQLIEHMPDVFRDAGAAFDSVTTRVVALVSEETLMHPDTMSLDGSRIKDNLSDTIMFVQAPPDRAVIWTKPEDLMFDPDDPLACVSPLPEIGLIATFADGHTDFLDTKIDAETFKALATCAGGEPVKAKDSFMYGPPK